MAEAENTDREKQDRNGTAFTAASGPGGRVYVLVSWPQPDLIRGNPLSTLGIEKRAAY